MVMLRVGETDTVGASNRHVWSWGKVRSSSTTWGSGNGGDGLMPLWENIGLGVLMCWTADWEP